VDSEHSECAAVGYNGGVMRFEVPQFIEIEDKIVGPFTWRQFVYIAGGTGLLVTLWFLLDSILLFALIGLPVGALAGSLAFQKVNNRPFSIFLEALFNYLTHKKLYLWRKSEEQEVVDKSEPAPEFPTATDPSAFVSRGAMKMLSRKLQGDTENQAS
jgi:hypothetical protein